MQQQVVGAASETAAGAIEMGLERLFFGKWREPAYEGPGSEPGWHAYSVLNREGRRERLEMRQVDGSWDLRSR